MENRVDAASVRVELADETGGIENPPAPEGSSGRGRAGVGALIVALGLVAALVFTNRPDDGTSAAGTPITIPTTTAPEVETPIEAISEQDQVASTTTATTVEEPAGLYETVATDLFFVSIVEQDGGWLAHAIGTNSASPSLWRSVDGLIWTLVPPEDLPQGDVLGIDRIDGVYVLAVDADESWSDPNAFNFAEGFPDHRITVWWSVDLITWEPSSLPVLDGGGFPYPVSFGRNGYVVPMLIEPEVENQRLIDLLAPFLDATDAASVCRQQPGDPTNGSRTVILVDCDGEIVAEIAEVDHPDDFSVLAAGYCIDVARDTIPEFALSFVNVSGATERVPTPNLFGFSGVVTETGYLSYDSAGGFASAECGSLGLDTAELDTTGQVLSFRSPGLERIDVSPPATTDPFQSMGQPPELARGDDGRYYTVFGGSIWAASEPFDEWAEVLEAPAGEQGLVGPIFSTLASDGRRALVAGEDRAFLGSVGGEWVEIPGLWNSEDHYGVQLLVATDEYVVVALQGISQQELVKVPIP